MDTITAKSANGATDPGLVSALAEDGAPPPAAPAAEPQGETSLAALTAAAGGPEVKLTFVNRSNGAPDIQVLVFGKPVSPAFDEAASAWLVIQNCAPGWSHPFAWPAAVTVGVVDSWGNVSPQLDIENGQVAAVKGAASGESLELTGQTVQPNAFGVVNQLDRGAVAVTVFRAGKPYAQVTGVPPQSQAIFSFKPMIWIGVASGVQQGQALDSAVLSQVNTEISLLGIASADIVMTGGGAGADARPFLFTLQNVIFA